MIIVSCNGQPDQSDVNWWGHLTQVEGGLHFEFQHSEGVNCIVIGPIYAMKNYPSSSIPRFGDRWIFSKLKDTDVGITWVLSSWAIPVCGKNPIAELADLCILLAIFCTLVQHLVLYTQSEQHRDLVYYSLYGTQMTCVWSYQESSGSSGCDNWNTYFTQFMCTCNNFRVCQIS